MFYDLFTPMLFFHIPLPIIKHWRFEVELFLICSLPCLLLPLHYLLLNTGGLMRECIFHSLGDAWEL